MTVAKRKTTWTSLTARYLLAVFDVGMGAWLGFWRGLAIVIGTSLLMLAGMWGARSADERMP